MQNVKLRWIQVLRAIAALMVVFYHFYVVYNYNSSKDDLFGFNSTLYPIARVLIGKGAFGVDLFFVLSGFIMFYSLKSFSTKDFLINRFSRVYPIFFISMIAFALLKFHYFLNMPMVFIFQLFFIPLGAPSPVLTPGYNLVIWTLNYEMYFYLMMGLSLLCNKHWFKALNIYFLLTLILVPLLVFKSFTFSASGYNFSSIGLKFITNPIILEFWLGLFIGYLFYEKKITFNKYLFNALSITILIAFFIAYVGLPRVFPLWGLAGIGAFAPFIILIFAYDDLNRVIKIEPPKWLVKLGDMSYSIYLWHPFVLEATYKYFYSNVPPFLIPPDEKNHFLIFYRGTPSVWLLPIYIAVVLLLSAISYYLIEVRLTKKTRNFLKAKLMKEKA